MISPNTPVLIAGGQFTFRGPATDCPTPIQLCVRAAHAACADIGLEQAKLAEIDGLGVVGFTIDAGGGLDDLPIARAANPPNALAKALQANPSWKVYSHVGGNTPQSLVNATAARIARGENKFVLLVGAEFLGSLMKLVQSGNQGALQHHDVPDDDLPIRFGDGRPGCSDYERAHGLAFPTNVYPLFENATRAQHGLSLEAHRAQMGALFAPFTDVAAANPFAWFPKARSGEELTTVTDANRMVGFPYPKYLNSVLQVDQSAGVLMASYAYAQSLGIGDDQMVFLHGHGDIIDKWHVLDRVNFHSSPAMEAGIKASLDMAGKTSADIAFFDLYSCFPIAVSLAAQALGLARNDPRGLTVTGGLPYFGGPGNNYSMHAIVETIARCRAQQGAFGFINANGWFLTKHAFGVYSTSPIAGDWTDRAQPELQTALDLLESPIVIDKPEGPATIETYTIVHARDTMRMGIVVGRDREGRRFVANTPKGDVAMMIDLQGRESVGRTGKVRHENGRNIFELDAF